LFSRLLVLVPGGVSGGARKLNADILMLIEFFNRLGTQEIYFSFKKGFIGLLIMAIRIQVKFLPVYSIKNLIMSKLLYLLKCKK
jgi:hypothetical protein